MKNIKKIIAVLTFVCMMLFLGACNTDNQTVNLIDFSSYQKEVVLGTMYSLPPAIVEDEMGKEYRVEYVIENELSEVQVNNNQFVIENLKDYVIKCNVNLSSKNVITRVITLTVKDEKAPIITLGEIAPGFVGVEYAIPVTVTDDSGETVNIEYTVTYENGGEQINLPVEDGKFTPSQMGEYLVKVNATDMHGNEVEESFSTYVRLPIGANEVISFSTPTDVTKVKSYGGDSANVEYLSEFLGKQGVVKLSYGNVWPSLQFKPLRQMIDYTGYDEIVFTVYLPKSGEYANADGNYVKFMKFGNNSADDILPNNVDREFANDIYDKWVELVFDAEKFKEYWTDDMQFSLSGSAPRLWGNTTSGGNATTGSYYLADISVRKSLQLSSEDITVNQGVATVPELSVVTTSGEQLIENQDYTLNISVTYDYGIPAGYQPNDKTFTANETGVTYTVKYEVTLDGFTYVYVKNLVIPREYRQDEVLSFDFRADVNKVTLNGTTSAVDWVDNFEGENGVLKCTYTGVWPSLYFLPNQDMAKYANASKIIFRMYICNDGVNPIKALVLGNRTGKDVVINLTSGQYNTWLDFEFDIEVFNEYWKTDGTVNHYYASFWMYTNSVADANPAESNFYIADIRVE